MYIKKGENMKDRWLFRGKSLFNGKLEYGSLFYDKYHAYISSCPPDVYDSELRIEHWEEVDPSTICQCIGLRDKNGVLIFEGDIIRHSKGEIKKNNIWEPHYEDLIVDIYTIWQLNQVCEYSCEITGNIHDN